METMRDYKTEGKKTEKKPLKQLGILLFEIAPNNRIIGRRSTGRSVANGVPVPAGEFSAFYNEYH